MNDLTDRRSAKTLLRYWCSRRIWLNMAALARLPKPLSPTEQRNIVEAAHTPHKCPMTRMVQ
jgi:hypothetical protein